MMELQINGVYLSHATHAAAAAFLPSLTMFHYYHYSPTENGFYDFGGK